MEVVAEVVGMATASVDGRLWSISALWEEQQLGVVQKRRKDQQQKEVLNCQVYFVEVVGTSVRS